MAAHFLLILHFRLQGCQSLKEKRSRLAPLLNKLKNQNVSVAETDLQDMHQEALISITKVSLNSAALDRDLDLLLDFIDENRNDLYLMDYQAERYT